MIELAPTADYQTRVTSVLQVQPGDFLDWVDPALVRGVRGKRYRYDGARVESRVESVAWVVTSGPGTTEELPVDGDWQPARPVGFKIRTRRGTTTLPGNMAALTSAVVRHQS